MTKFVRKSVTSGIIVVNLFIVGGILTIFSSCADFIDIDPPRTGPTDKEAYENDVKATSVMLGIYSDIMEGNGFASGDKNSVTVLAGLSADEFVNGNDIDPKGIDRDNFYKNTLTPNTDFVATYLWGDAYETILYANTLLEGLKNSVKVTTLTKMQLEGEARFIRAFCHFYLVNMFGDVPIITDKEYETNKTPFRAKKDVVYDSIISDLTKAVTLLGNDNSLAFERARPSKGAARALLARVYLYTEQWQKAADLASEVINDSFMYKLTQTLDSVFLADNQEAIWQLAPVQEERDTNEGNVFILLTSPMIVSMSGDLCNAFESNDKRKTSWINSLTLGSTKYYYPYKYKVRSKPSGASIKEYSTVLRLAEQYLIRAEARAQQEDILGALEDLNMIRNRAGLDDVSTNDKIELLKAIERERRIEFFAEWGHRWFDLKRTHAGFTDVTRSRADELLGLSKADNWQSTDELYPIPQSERNLNKNLSQNPGYAQ